MSSFTHALAAVACTRRLPPRRIVIVRLLPCSHAINNWAATCCAATSMLFGSRLCALCCTRSACFCQLALARSGGAARLSLCAHLGLQLTCFFLQLMVYLAVPARPVHLKLSCPSTYDVHAQHRMTDHEPSSEGDELRWQHCPHLPQHCRLTCARRVLHDTS